MEEQVLNISPTELIPRVTLPSTLPGYPLQFYLSATFLLLFFIFRGVQITVGLVWQSQRSTFELCFQKRTLQCSTSTH